MADSKINIKTESGETVQAFAPVIVSASRSTDIPAFYAYWFFHRLKVGYSVWTNPFNGVPSYVSYQNTRFIVFWSKNPRPLLAHLDYLKEHSIGCYIQYTLNDYEVEGLEKGVPPLDQRIDTFKKLVDKLGVGRVIWRFDPMILTDRISIDDLLGKVRNIGDQLKGYAEKLVFSYADIASYKKVKANLEKNNIPYREWEEDSMNEFARRLSAMNRERGWNYTLATCGEKIGIEQYGIVHNRCVDDDLMIRLSWDDTELMKFLNVEIHRLQPSLFDEPEIPGVFTLGEASNDSLCQIEEKQRLLREIVDEGSKLRKTLNEKETEIKNIKNSFKESVWSDLLKRHESRFSKSAIGAGTKDSFVKKVLDATKDKVEEELELESLTDKAKVLFGIQPVRQTPIAKINADELYPVESNELWAKIVVGKQDIDLAGLINSLGNSDWVSQGLIYIDKSRDICPFCQQHTITDEFKKKISSFFDADYKNDLHQIGSLQDAYNQIAVIIIKQLDSIVNAQKVLEKSSMDISAFETVVSEFKLLLTSNQNLMKTKSKEPSRVIAPKSTKELISRINGIIDDSNLKISKHNQLIDNLSTERIMLVKQIYKYFSIAYSAAIESYRKKVSDLEKATGVLKSKIEIALSRHKSVKNEINELERAITSITPTVNEINRLLQGFGFTNFMIREVPKEVNQYQIVRENGDIATSTLSEGERTFITFLYYMQLVKGSHTPDGVSRNRVLIIDDPVSSLDSNVLFVVSTLLRDIFASVYDGRSIVRQIILLTHNVYFHKEISFQDKGCKWRDRIHHWILRKRNNVSSIQAYYKTNPIRSSYELLWSELRNDSSISCLVSQNIMRRIVENYFQIFGGISPNDILNKFDNFEDKKICRSLLSWVNNGSHSMADDLFVEIADGQLERYKEVFKNIFCKMGQEAHYDMMMHLSNPENK